MNGTFDLVRLVDLVIVIAVLECLTLAAYRLRTGRGIPLRDFVPNMLSGIALMLALRCRAADTGLVPIAACLMAAGAAHGTDILMRLRRFARPTAFTLEASA